MTLFCKKKRIALAIFFLYFSKNIYKLQQFLFIITLYSRRRLKCLEFFEYRGGFVLRSEIKAESFSRGQFGVNGDQVFFTGRTEQRFLFDAAYVKIGKLIERQGLFGRRFAV